MLEKYLWTEIQNKASFVYFSTGTKTLDDILGGGFCPGEIIEISGESGAGKSWFCTKLACNYVKDGNGCVLYIESQNSLSTHVIKSNFVELHDENTLHSSSAKFIFSCKVVTYYELHNLLDYIQSMLEKKKAIFRLVIIDSLASMNMDCQGSVVLFNCLVQKLRYLTRKWEICAIIVGEAQVNNISYSRFADIILQISHKEATRGIGIIKSSRSACSQPEGFLCLE